MFSVSSRWWVGLFFNEITQKYLTKFQKTVLDQPTVDYIL